MDDELRIVARGAKRTVAYAVRADGTVPARDFLESLEKADQNRLRTLMTHVANVGELHINNDRLVKKERPPFWALKHKCRRTGEKGRTMVRIVFFRDGDRLVLTHGFWKPPQSKWPESEFTRAEQIHEEFLARERNPQR